MIKFSSSNIIVRMFYLMVSLVPIIFYLFLKYTFDWQTPVSIGTLFFLLFSMMWFLFFFLFGCLDWDFYIKKREGFIFKRNRKCVVIPINTKCEIKPVIIGTTHFFLFKIKFESGCSFMFVSKPSSRVLTISLQQYAKEIEHRIAQLSGQSSSSL